ncbi:MAG: hypothetical protein WC451_01555 [Patescibacteria group bacterium]|jgi:hypothetical protein
MTESNIAKVSAKKWYQKPFWLIGLVVLAFGSISDSTSVERFLILIFVITGILFLLWFYSAMKTKHKFFAFTISMFITIILLIVLFLLLNWIKCGGSYYGIFGGRCPTYRESIYSTSSTTSGKKGLDKY